LEVRTIGSPAHAYAKPAQARVKDDGIVDAFTELKILDDVGGQGDGSHGYLVRLIGVSVESVGPSSIGRVHENRAHDRRVADLGFSLG
jgi:hypothetical protein